MRIHNPFLRPSYQVGEPPLLSTMRARRRAAAYLWVSIFVLPPLAAALAAPSWHSGATDDAKLWWLVACMGYALLGLDILGMAAIRWNATKKLTPAQCEATLYLVNSHPELYRHVAAINAQGREVLNGDLEFLYDWVKRREIEIARAKAIEQQRENCRALRQIGVE